MAALIFSPNLNVNMAKSPFNSELFKFAYFPTWDDSVKYLAETLSDREEWDFSGTVAKSYPI